MTHQQNADVRRDETTGLKTPAMKALVLLFIFLVAIWATNSIDAILTPEASRVVGHL